MDPTPAPHPAGAQAAVSPMSRGRLIDVLTDTLSDLDALDLSLEVPGIEEHRRLRDRLTVQVRDHVLPRLQDADVPAVVVLGGSTGAGKSTLVNSLLGEEVSQAGVLRPTTRTPVLVANPEDAGVIAEHPVAQACRVTVSERVPAGLVLIDASDLDSVHEANRALAARLLEAADLWLFVTTAARYGDQTPWATLEQAADRGTPVGVILNRAPARVLAEVRRDLVERLAALGLADSPLFIVPDAGPHEGPLPASSVAELDEWLSLLAGRHRAEGLVRRTGRHQWSVLRRDLQEMADAVDAQADGARELADATRGALAARREALTSDLEGASAGQGAPETRWAALASSGGPLAGLAQGGAMRRGWFGRASRARSEALALLAEECRQAVSRRVLAETESLAQDVDRVWQRAGAGRRAGAPEPAAGHVASPADPGHPAPAGRGAGDSASAGRGPNDPAHAAGPADAADPAHAADPAEAVASWSRGIAPMVPEPPSGLSPEGAADLVVAAVTGVTGAAGAAERLGLGRVVERAAQDLREASSAVLAHAAPVDAALALAPEPSLAAALRLRAAELTPLTRPGERA